MTQNTPPIIKPQRRLNPWQGNLLTTVSGVVLLQKPFIAVPFLPNENAVKLIVSLTTQSDVDISDLEVLVALTDGVETQGISEKLTEGGDVSGTFVYVLKWGSQPSSFNAPNLSGAQPLITTVLPDGTVVGNEAELCIGGRPDTSGALTAILQVGSAGKFHVKAFANLITWGE